MPCLFSIDFSLILVLKRVFMHHKQILHKNNIALRCLLCKQYSPPRDIR
nr:MAG TPA: hypothetical protein [Caudoviricetes sp.]